MSEFTDKLMNRARELDSRPGLSSSSAPSGSSGGSGSFSERLLSRARELDRKVTPSYTWQGHEQAERDFDAWAPRIEEMDASLANREKILNGYVERLQALQEEPYSQSNAYKYRAMYDNYEKALREYNDMVRERNALSGRMGSALEQYRSWSGGQDAQAETYRQEAAALDERNAELDREMRNYALVNTPFGLENAGPYQAMQEEYDANAARAAELRRMADEAQWQYYGGLRLNEDWDEHQNVLTVAEMADRGYITESPYYDGSLVYEYINDINNRRDMMHGYDASGTRYEAYSKMTPDEIAVYNYIYSAQGPEAAETYLSRLRNELNTRLGTENYEEMGGLGKALYWIPAGFDRFAQGLRQLGKEEAVPVTPMTVTSSLIQQEAQETSPALGGLYDLGANITNMVPSLLASVLTGGAFGAAAGSALLGASAGGNTYADVMRDPERQYSAQQARDYATLVGVSEGALSYLLGGISRLGGVSTRQVLTKLGGLDNALGRIARSSAAPYVMSMISEGTEEGLQELLEPAFATLILGTEYDANFGDAAYAFLLGALTAGIVEGAEIGASRALGGGQGFTYSDMDGFVGENGVNYFEGCNTLEEVESRYRELARENHPDLGGDTSVMADINRQHDMAKAFFQGRRQGAEQRRERRDEAEGETARGAAGALTAAQEAAQKAGDMAAAERAALRADAAALAPRTVPNAVTAAPVAGETAAEALGDVAAAPGVSGALENNLGGITDERAERAAGVFGGDGGRLPDTGSGGQVRELEEGARRTRLSSAEQGRAALERQAAARNLRAEKVSAADLGVASGTDTATSTVYPEELWDDELQRVAEEIYNRAGREVTYVIGSLEVEGADGTRSRVRGVWSEDGNIIVQVDNMRVSASQIADHELYHHAANNLPGMDYVAEERIIEQYGEEEFSRVLDVYIKKMRGIIRLPANATNEEIDNALAYVKQEVFADAYAGINAFGAGADRFYDTVREVVKERTGGGPRSETEEAVRDITGPPAGERYSYAGQNAVNADLEALDAAEEMERRGVDAETIRQQTGWFRGRDGKWPFEIDDSGMEYRYRGDAAYGDADYQRYAGLRERLEADMLGLGGEPLTEAETAEFNELRERFGEMYTRPGERGDGSAPSNLLSQYIRHGELFEQYPWLENVGLRFEDLDARGGYFDPGSNVIFLDESLRSKAQDTIVHEVQHAIQQAEGFARGASTNYWRFRAENNQSALNTARMAKDAYLERIGYGDFERELRTQLESGAITEDEYNRRLDEFISSSEYGRQITRRNNEIARREADAEAFRNPDIDTSPRTLYRNTAGEIEARDAESRRRLTADERRATPPDLGDENTVFADDEIPVKARFSLDEPVERTADLVAVHNIYPDDLARTLELGAFPMPSIAVIRDSVRHDDFGNISIVFGSDTINPERDSRNRVYSRDAWTPTFPRTDTSGMSVDEIVGLMERQPERQIFGDNPGRRLMMASIESFGSLDEIRAAEGRIDGTSRNSQTDVNHLGAELVKTAESLITPENVENTNIYAVDDAEIADFNRLYDLTEELAAAKDNKVKERRGDEEEEVLSFIWADAVDDVRDTYAVEAEALVGNLTLTPKFMRTVDNLLTQEEADFLEITEEEARHIIDVVNDVGSRVTMNEAAKDAAELSLDSWAQDVILAAAEGPHNLQAVKDTLEGYGFTPDDESANRVLALINEAAALSTRYFEAKPHRVVEFNEIRGVVMPDDVGGDLGERLSALNIPVIEYRAGDEADRARAVNSVEGARFSLDEEEDAPVSQAISSAKTSLRQVPALFKNPNVRFGEVNIDIGGGRFDLATEYLAERGTRNLVFDPYNRGEETNRATLDYLMAGNRADTATNANVLNVIAEAPARANVVLEMAKAIKPDGRAYFMVYEGDGSGVGRETSAGYQNNRKTADYAPEIERFFDRVERRGKLIIATQPKANLPRASWEVQQGSAVRYSIDEDVPAEQAEQGPRQSRQRRTTKPVAESKPIIAAQNLRRNIYAQFSIPEGQRAEISRFLDGYTEKLIKNGELSDADRAELFDRLYAAGVMTVPADEYYSVGREAVVGRRMYVDEATKRDFGDDWNSIRRRAFGAGIYLTDNPADMAADQWNAELGETLPGLFNAEETDPRAIIERVIQVAEEGRDEQMSLAEYTNFIAGQEYVSEDEVLNQLENQLDWDLRTFAESAGIEIKLRDRTGVKIEQERERAWESRRDIRRRADERVREADERRWAAQAEARERIERMTQEERKKYYERSERERVRRLNRETRERERRKAMAERQRQNRELRELQKKTLNQLRWLARNQHRAPKELQETWNDVLGDIDLYAINAANEMNWSNKYQATWRDLAEMYKQAKKYDANFLPSQELERIVARLDNEKLADMDIGALQDLYKAAVGLRTEFYNRNNVINDEKGRLFAELYAESKEEINSAPGGYTKGVKHAADNYANLMQLTPMNVLERMAGWNPDSAFYSMAKQLEKGEMDERAYIVQANRMLEDFLREHEEWVMRSDGQGKDAIWYEIEVPELLELGMGDKPIFGDTVKVYMTPAQKVHLYLESKNYDNLRHIAGGRTFPDKELYSEGKRQEAYAQGRTIRLAPETVRHLVENMTAEEQELAGILERYYNNFAAERINAVSNVLYGYDRAITRNYAPIYTNSNYNQKELGKFDQTAEGVGNMKERVKGSKNPSYNISAYDAFERHVDQTARFVGMAIPARNWQTLLNWRERNNSMSDVITHKWGKESLDYITSLLQDLQGGSPRKEQFAISKGIDKLWSNYISAIFGANPSIIIKQLGSIPMGGAYLGIENVPSLSQLAQIDRELISKYTSELDWRLMGYATPETKQLKDHPNWTQRNSFFRTVFGGGAITRMDGWAASALWPWAENKVKREQPELTIGTAEEISAGNSPFYKEVAREFNNAVSRSQSMSDTLHNAKIRKSDNLILRTFTMFKSDSAQTYNAIRQKIGEAQYYKRIAADAKAQRAARIAIGTAILAFLLNAAWGEAVNFLINLWKKKGKDYRDDEDRLTAESAIKEMVFNMVGSLGGVVLGGEELADIIGNIITGDRWYGIDAPGVEQVNDSLEAIMDAGKSLMNLVGEAENIASQGGDVSAYFAEHSSDIVGGVKELAETAAMYLAGLPVSNVEAYILGILRWVSPELVTAYEDALATADKSGLSSLTGEALATRVKDILAGRLETVDDETASAIGTLYEAGYASVVPPAAPSSVTVDHESYELDAYAQQRYNQAWADAIGGALDEVVATPEFRSATTEEKANMVRRLYEYANAKGRDAAVPEYVLPDWVAEVDADLAAGGSLSEWAVYEVLSSDVSGTFDRLTDEGLGRGDALDIAETLDGLGEDASSTEKYMAIAELPISEAEKDMALEGIMSESAYAKYAAAREAGIDTYDYCAFLDHIAGISGDGRQERIWAYIDAMPLTDAQKDALHLAAGYKESTLGKAPWRR